MKTNSKITITLSPRARAKVDEYRGDIPRSKFISRSIEYISENYKEFSKWYSIRIKEEGDTGE